VYRKIWPKQVANGLARASAAPYDSNYRRCPEKGLKARLVEVDPNRGPKPELSQTDAFSSMVDR